MTNKTSYIMSLDLEIQQAIKNDIKMVLDDNELINDAMNSRLCDLEDLIDINKYL